MIQRFVLWCIHYYRRNISPHKRGGPCCRYIPSCSRYAVTAVERYGVWKGGAMALWRILRCNPFAKGGYDPVPEDPNLILRKE